MKNYLTLLLCLCALFLNSCKKTESEPLTTTTEQITGNNGQTILGGSGLPNATYGNNGDFYLDKTTANLYGPKVDNAWPQPFNLANNTGTTGTPGTKILSGTIAPALNIGAIGDFYFDTAVLNFYGPKTTASWGLPISLKVQTDGAKVLIYKNQVFASVVRNVTDTAGTTARQSKIRLDLEQLNIKYEGLKLKWVANIFYKANDVAYILPIRATADKQLEFRRKLASMFAINNTITASQFEFLNISQEFFETEKKIIDLEIDLEILEKNIIEKLALKNFILDSEIAIDAKYQDYYDNGMVVVYFRDPLIISGSWQESVGLLETKDPNTGFTSSRAYVGLKKILKDKVYLQGNSYKIDEAIVKAAKFDVKIVFIPASEVITMGAAKIDTHNLKAVTRYLGVALNK